MYRFSITALLLGIAPLLSTTPLSAQITLDTSNLSVPIGSTFTLESLTYQGPLAQAPIELGPAGANQTYEVTRPLGGPVRIELRSTVVRLSEAPSHGKPIVLYAGRSRGADSYVELAKEIIFRSKLDEHPSLKDSAV